VEVAALVREDGCHVEVRDRGLGIAPEVRDRVFEPFVTTKSSGTGLGLPIVKRVMTALEGSVALHPRHGGGTIAEIVVPEATAANRRLTGSRAIPHSRRRWLALSRPDRRWHCS
jgi:signal transduction histidine kinase